MTKSLRKQFENFENLLAELRDSHQGKHTFKQNWSADKKYGYRYLGNWCIKSTIYKGFIYWN